MEGIIVIGILTVSVLCLIGLVYIIKLVIRDIE